MQNLIKNIYIDSAYQKAFNIAYMSYDKEKQSLYDCELTLLCDMYGSDKGSILWNANHPYAWLPHTYAPVYQNLFYEKKLKSNCIFECGVGSNNPDFGNEYRKNIQPGASLRVWQDFFPKSLIFGADIDPLCLFNENRIHTGLMDQTDPNSINHFFAKTTIEFWDIMIDDGLHTAEAAKILFDNASKYLKKDGIYIIEDMNYSNIISLKRYFMNQKYECFDIKYILMCSDVLPDNNLIVIQYRTES